MNGQELLESLNKMDDETLELPVVCEAAYFEKYPLIVKEITWGCSRIRGKAISLDCMIHEDICKDYTDLREAYKHFKYIEKTYKEKIQEHFEKFGDHVNQFELKYSNGYRDELILWTWNGFNHKALLSFVEEFGYNMPRVEMNEEEHSVYCKYVFYKKKVRL